MDGDGDLDLFVGGLFGDPNKIYENDGNCRFTDVTSNSPDVENMRASHTISSSFGDYDLDGDLDMFLTHWATRDRVYAKVVDGGLEFLETNVRTYVHRDGREPGVYFFSLDAGSLAAVLGARAAFGLVILQTGVAAAMVLLNLPAVLRSLHEAIGVSIWLTTFSFAYLARLAARAQRDRATGTAEPAVVPTSPSPASPTPSRAPTMAVLVARGGDF